MSSLTESRGIQYSAQAAAEAGNVRCHVTRRALAHERRAQYSIFVCNDSKEDAHALAFVPDAVAQSPRTIVQTSVGPGSDFSTSVVLELTPAGLMPELRVAVTCGRTQFTLVVPGLQIEFALPERSAADRRLAARVSSLGSKPRTALPVVRAVYAPPAQPFVTVKSVSSPEDRRPLPPLRPASPSPRPILLACGALAAIVGFFIARPQISDLGVPASAAPGTPVVVSYRAGGLGSADYALLGPDGQTIVRGPLALGSGIFVLTLPRTAGTPAYLVRVRVSNALGSSGAEEYIRVDVPPPPVPARRPAPPRRQPAAVSVAPLQIRSLALDRATVASGDTLTVYYDVQATSGSIALYDPAAQLTYGSSALAAAGHSTFIAPHVDAPRLLEVVATAQRGGAKIQSRIGVNVTPGDLPAQPSGDASDLGSDAAIEGKSSITGIYAPATARSQQAIRVDVSGAVAGLDVVLLDGGGREIARRDLSTGQRSVDFTAPAVARPTRFVIEATYPHGNGSETVVRGIMVRP